MKKTEVLIFTEHNAKRIWVEDPAPYVGAANAVISPDLSLVKGVKPHHWKLKDGKVVPMTEGEKEVRDEYHENNVYKNPEVIEVVRWAIKEVPVEVEKVVEVERIVRVIPSWVHIAYAMLLGAAVAVSQLLK